jgi:hypothetical protein
VSEGKHRIASHRIGEMVARLIHHRRIAGGSDPIAAHEFRICHRIPAIAWALLDHRRTIRPVQCPADLLRKIAFETRKAIHVDVALLGEVGALQVGVEHLQRKAPLAF